MTVSELIDLLNTFPKDSTVELYDPVEDITSDVDKAWIEDGIVIISMECWHD